MTNISLPPPLMDPNAYFQAQPAMPTPVPAPQLTIFSDLLRAVRRYRGIGICVFAIGVGATVYTAFQQQAMYMAEATIRLDSRETRLDRLQSTTDRLLTGNVSDVSVVRTEVEILKSPHLIGRVVEELGLAAREADEKQAAGASLVSALTGTIRGYWTKIQPEPTTPDPEIPDLGIQAQRSAEERAVARIVSKLQAEAVANSYLVSVRYRDPDPEIAAAVVNRLVELYAADQREAKERLARDGFVWLERQLQETRQALLDSEADVARFREANGLSEVNGLTVVAQQIAEATRELSTVNNQVQQLQAEYREIERARADRINQLSATRFLESPIIQRLLEQESELAREEAEKNTVLGPNHPAIRDLQSRRRTLQAQIKREIDGIARAAERSLAAARSQAAAIQGRLDKLTQQQGQLSGASASLRDLEQVAAVNRALYNDLLREYRETAARERQQNADVTIIATASPPTRGKTGKLMILAGGMVASVALALLMTVGLSWWRNGLIDPRDLTGRTGVRSLGFMPEIKKSERRKFLANQGPANTAIIDAALAVFHSLATGGQRGRPRAVMVTSAVPDEGKTFTAIALARAVALSGRGTLLIDLDCRRPSVERAVEADIVDRSAITLQTGSGEVKFMLAKSKTPQLSYLFFRPSNRTTNILSSQDVSYLLQTARQQFDVVIVDSPPVLAASEALGLGRFVDRTIFAVRWERTSASTARNAFEAAREAGTTVDGFVISRVNLSKHARYKLNDRGSMFKKYSQQYAKNPAAIIGS